MSTLKDQQKLREILLDVKVELINTYRSNNSYDESVVVATILNDVHLTAAVHRLKSEIPKLKKGDHQGWACFHFKDIVVHLMTDDARRYYRIDEMYLEV